MDDLKDLGRQLVARYAEQGLGGMSAAEVRLLLTEKQLHLGQIGERLSEGKEPLVNFALKGALERQVCEIGQAVSYQEMLDGASRATDRQGRGEIER
jgi:hypothetical protein